MSELTSRHAHMLQLVSAAPWAILPDYLYAMPLAVEHLSAEEMATIVAAAAARTPSGGGGTAVIPIAGPIVPRSTIFSEIFGGTSAEAIGRTVRMAAASPDVAAIVLDINSPGGNVQGVEEAAAAIHAAAQVKPVYAVAGEMAASAAYWLGAQATEFVASPSAMVGSVGVIAVHQDMTGRLEQEGVKVTVISAGKHKADGLLSLSDDALAHEQSIVDGYYAQMVGDIARGRGVSAADVEKRYGQGRVYRAPDAVRFGMIDGIDTLEGVLGRLTARSSSRPVARAEHGVVAALQERLQVDALARAVANAWKD